MAIATINNGWITLQNLYKGVTVQRKFAGLSTKINADTNEVLYCEVYYYQRELYPNGDTIKTEEKHYTLANLPYTELQENGNTYYMEAIAVLDGFIQTLGQPYIVDQSRESLMNDELLPPDSINGYELRKDTREKILKP